MEGNHHEKICPILAAFGSRDSISSGSTWACRCKGDECGWWDDDQKKCAVSVISKEIGQMITSTGAAAGAA